MIKLIMFCLGRVFPIGELVGPLIVAPFLGKDANSSFAFEALNSTLTNETDNNGIIDALFGVTKKSDLWIPYMIISSLKFMLGVLVFIAYMIKVRLFLTF